MLWPPLIHEAPADEHRGRHLIELRELTDGIEDDDLGARLGVDRQIGAARRDKSRVAREPLDFAQSARGGAAQGSRARSACVNLIARERAQHGGLFAAQRAARDDCHP